MSITEDVVLGSDDQALLKLAAEPSHRGSGAALWVLLLLRLTSVATDQRLELRNSKRFPHCEHIIILTTLQAQSRPSCG